MGARKSAGLSVMILLKIGPWRVVQTTAGERKHTSHTDRACVWCFIGERKRSGEEKAGGGGGGGER